MLNVHRDLFNKCNIIVSLERCTTSAKCKTWIFVISYGFLLEFLTVYPTFLFAVRMHMKTGGWKHSYCDLHRHVGLSANTHCAHCKHALVIILHGSVKVIYKAYMQIMKCDNVESLMNIRIQLIVSFEPNVSLLFCVRADVAQKSHYSSAS